MEKHKYYFVRGNTLKIIKKSYLLYITLYEDDIYMKIVALDEIYNFVILSFFI